MTNLMDRRPLKAVLSDDQRTEYERLRAEQQEQRRPPEGRKGDGRGPRGGGGGRGTRP